MEKIDIKEMLESLLIDLTNNAPVDNYIYKLQLIATYINNDVFKEYIDKEFFSGYTYKDTIPDYRKIGTTIKYKGIISLYDKDNPATIKKDISKTEIYESIPEIIDLCKSNSELIVKLTKEEKSNIIYHANINIYKAISKTDLQNIVRKVKAKLLEFIIQLNNEVYNDEIDFNVISAHKTVESIANNYFTAGVIHTGRGNVDIVDSTIINGNNNSINDIKKRLQDILQKIETLANEVDDDRTDIASAILTLREELQTPSPKVNIIRMGFNAIKGAATKLVDKGIDVLVDEGLKLLE